MTSLQRMGKRKLNSLRIILAFLALLSFGMLQVNNTVNLHYHTTADGGIIVHAHPYNHNTDNTPIKHHHHSLVLYSLTQGTQSFEHQSITFALDSPWQTKESIFILYKNEIPETESHNRYVNRPPPLFV